MDNLEQRLAALEEQVRDVLAANQAMDMLARSLIATHPNPGFLGDVLEGVLKQRADQFRDVGFEKGYSPQTTGSALSELGRYAQMWIEVCRASARDD